YFGDGKYVKWEEGIIEITGDKRPDRAEDKFQRFLCPETKSEKDLIPLTASLRENGFPPGQVESYRERYARWWQGEKSRIRSESRKKSAGRRKQKPAPEPMPMRPGRQGTARHTQKSNDT